MTHLGELIASCREHWDSLSEWEQEFVDSLDEQIAAGKSLSVTQLNKLEQIVDERVNGEQRSDGDT